MRVLIGLLLILWLTLECREANAAERLPASSALVEAGDWSAADVFVADGQHQVQATADGAGSVLVLTTNSAQDVTWASRVRLTVPAATTAGQVCLIRFQARALASRDETGHAFFELILEQRGEPWTKLVFNALSVGDDWQQFDVPVVIDADRAANGIHLGFNTAEEAQSIGFRQLELRRFPIGVTVDQLPSTVQHYQADPADAAWRLAAAERIRRLRTGVLAVQVVEADGSAIAGAEVSAQMTRSAFAWGTAVNAAQWLGQRADGMHALRYRDTVSRWFDHAVIENALKWQQVEQQGHTAGVAVVAGLRERGLRVRGHVLVWPGWRWLPERLQQMVYQPAELRAEVQRRVADATATYRGQLTEWDVVNEPYANRDLMDVLGDDLVAEVFRWAQTGDPQARLVLNDYGLLTDVRGGNPHLDAFTALVRQLQAAGAPVEALGVQGHFGQHVPRAPRMLAALDRLAEHGLPIRITEFDHDHPDPAVQAAFLRDLLTVVYSHPAVDGFLMWGFWDGSHWKGNAPLFHADWTPKPALAVWQELVHGEWRTTATGVSDAEGRVGLNGHLGDYEVVIHTADGRRARALTSLAAGGTPLVVRLPVR